MTPSQLPGYLGREIPEALPLLFTATVFLSFFSLALMRKIFVTTPPPHTPPSTPLKTWLLGLIMTKVTADRSLRRNINYLHSDTLTDVRNKPQDSFLFFPSFLITAAYTDEQLNYESLCYMVFLRTDSEYKK